MTAKKGKRGGQGESKVLEKWSQLLEGTVGRDDLDLDYVDHLLDEPIKDEIVRLPYEEPPSGAKVWLRQD